MHKLLLRKVEPSFDVSFFVHEDYLPTVETLSMYELRHFVFSF